MVYLLCQWAKSSEGPAALVVWAPTTAIGTWTDGGGAGQTGDYPTFLAAVDFNTLSDLNLSVTGITSLTVGNCPLLTSINCRLCPSLTHIDVKSCASLVTLNSEICNLTGSLDLSGLTLLTTVFVDANPLLLSLDLTGCISMTGLACYDCGLTSLKIGNSTFYTVVVAENNALPDTPNGVNECLISLESNCLGNSGTVDVSLGTNASPSGAGAVASANLSGAGWTVATN